MTKPKVCAIILNWNGLADTLECLNSLIELGPGPATIVVCDNGSTDGSRESIPAWVRERYPHDSVLLLQGPHPPAAPSSAPPPFVFIQNDANLGYASGNNAGIRFALNANRFDYIWTLNNDTVVHKDALAALLACAERNPGVGIFGSTIVYADRPGIVQCAGGCRYNPLTTVFRANLQGQTLGQALKLPVTLKLDYVYGASIFVRSEVFQECGFFNEEYFLFYEEIDFCQRAGRKGYELGWCKESIIAHKMGQSVGAFTGDERKTAFANYHENLSTLLYTRRFHPALLPISMLFRFFGKLAMIVRRRNWYLLRPLVAAYKTFWEKCREDHSA